MQLMHSWWLLLPRHRISCSPLEVLITFTTTRAQVFLRPSFFAVMVFTVL
ncbi:hypothetical protein N184_10250 [Sinorhizobium sp. GL28]|nr:hypothetical protein N183_04815 [Sinorhizobium sp. Sb3]KSV88029.1 hypothetical protein N184_10250 [Sinorhizobium sp. GL28]